MPSIITQGLGSEQRIVLQGYGQGILAQWMYETINIQEQIYKRITKPLYETGIFVDTFSPYYPIFLSLGEILSLSDTVERLWQRAVLALPKVIRRYLPYRFKPFKQRFTIVGDLRAPIAIEKDIVGSPLFERKLEVEITGDLKAPFSSKEKIIGSPKYEFRIQKDIIGNLRKILSLQPKVIGSPSFKIVLRKAISGSLKSKLVKLSKIRGKKVFKKVLWEILEEEDNGNGET